MTRPGHRIFRLDRAFEYRPPRQEGAEREWVIPAFPAACDSRTTDGLVVSYGYPEGKGQRLVSLRIDNRVAILDQLAANALIKLLAGAFAGHTGARE